MDAGPGWGCARHVGWRNLLNKGNKTYSLSLQWIFQLSLLRQMAGQKAILFVSGPYIVFGEFHEAWQFWVLQRTRQSDLQWWWFHKTALPDWSLEQDKLGEPSGINCVSLRPEMPSPLVSWNLKSEHFTVHSLLLRQTGTNTVKCHTDDFLKGAMKLMYPTKYNV